MLAFIAPSVLDLLRRRSVEHDELPLRGSVPVVIVTGLVLPEDDRLRRDGLRQAADRTGVLQLDVLVLEVALAVLVGADAGDLHAGPSWKPETMCCNRARHASSSSSLIGWGIPG